MGIGSSKVTGRVHAADLPTITTGIATGTAISATGITTAIDLRRRTGGRNLIHPHKKSRAASPIRPHL